MIGLYFGSFNPIHIGHLVIANYFVEYANLTELWFIVSPHNPLKEKNTLLPDYQRFEITSRALGDYPKFKASNIEFSLPQPSYTTNTLAYLKEKHPNKQFALIMGEDNLRSFHKWKNYKQLLAEQTLLVYPRPGCKKTIFHDHKNVHILDAPNMEISSSFIRKAIHEGKDIRFFVPEKAWEYIDEMNFYRK
ncbi:MAG: nicotinate (nicotinamide) nucleotide adenylyltransferase [Salinivirgaceae bacterium]|jgi:nicotinate-nucleotide adenylyltransferase|nr:nicotinate (nicotinamide) nucleotide adenylyltransferase [Salinivirgaceae bacterium]